MYMRRSNNLMDLKPKPKIRAIPAIDLPPNSRVPHAIAAVWRPSHHKGHAKIEPINFNLDFSAFQYADLVNGLIKADTLPGPAWAAGGYGDAAVSQYGTATNTRCLVAMRQDLATPAKKCP
jgi:hypothetical protein